MTVMVPLLVLRFCLYLATVATRGHCMELSRSSDVTIEPNKAEVPAGSNVTFTCIAKSSPSDGSSLQWDLNPWISTYQIERDHAHSRVTVLAVSRLMSGSISCKSQDGTKAIAYLSVKGARISEACHNSSDCVTDKAVCQEGACECPLNFVHMRVVNRSGQTDYDACRKMIYSLYDPCDVDEQCKMVDPKSTCNAICICAPDARDQKGKCVLLSEISQNRSQEMYRVGLIAITCIIILIVAMSLWVTLKRSCREQMSGSQNGLTQGDMAFPEIVTVDPSADKPPAYDDVIVCSDSVSSPPNIKDALKHCMTAKRLIRQVSAPAGQLLPEQGLNINPKLPDDFKSKAAEA